MRAMRTLLAVACTALLYGASAANHRYKLHDPVPLFANKVGPFSNPS